MGAVAHGVAVLERLRVLEAALGDLLVPFAGVQVRIATAGSNTQSEYEDGQYGQQSAYAHDFSLVRWQKHVLRTNMIISYYGQLSI